MWPISFVAMKFIRHTYTYMKLSFFNSTNFKQLLEKLKIFCVTIAFSIISFAEICCFCLCYLYVSAIVVSSSILIRFLFYCPKFLGWLFSVFIARTVDQGSQNRETHAHTHIAFPYGYHGFTSLNLTASKNRRKLNW